ncbi:MAG: hypothetical protein ABI726_04660, partial [bacterium]
MIGATACVVVGLLAVPAASAGAPGPTVSLGKSHGLEYMKAKFRGVVSQAGPPANCDGDNQVTGGGGSISGDPATARLNATYPLDGASTGWQSEGTATSGTARKVAAWAICGTKAVDYRSQLGAALGDNTVSFGLIPCVPAAPDPLSGGGRATGPGILIIANQPVLPPSTVGWQTVPYNNSGSDTVWNSYAVCSGDYEVRYRSSAPTKLKAGEAGGAVARCKPNEAVLGGGFVGTNDEVVGYRTSMLATKPWDSKNDAKKVPDDGWSARARNIEAALKVSLVAQATCLHP